VKTYGSALLGIHATIVTVEVNVAQGVMFSMVGLPDSAVKEAQQRIAAALKNIKKIASRSGWWERIE
jgi:magnesium chelatase family protein